MSIAKTQINVRRLTVPLILWNIRAYPEVAMSINSIRHIYSQRQVSNALGGPCRPLDANELAFIEGWIHEQMTVAAPDVDSWTLLWTDRTTFFSAELESMIGQDIYRIVSDGAYTAVMMHNDLYQWEKISLSLQTLLLCIDTNAAHVFDADRPVLFRVEDPLDAWRIGWPGDKDEGELTQLERPDYTDVLSVLLRSWESDDDKAPRARELLCDLLGKCVSDARNRLSASP
ncbi:MAG: hypothetical protein WCT54_05275 [Patescibacteria group bacterium]